MSTVDYPVQQLPHRLEDILTWGDELFSSASRLSYTFFMNTNFRVTTGFIIAVIDDIV
jgi:hypothetical protein